LKSTVNPGGKAKQNHPSGNHQTDTSQREQDSPIAHEETTSQKEQPPNNICNHQQRTSNDNEKEQPEIKKAS
jgi:hypothetical protein